MQAEPQMLSPLHPLVALARRHWCRFAAVAMPALYRLAAYFMTSLLDDPAMLALAFC